MVGWPETPVPLLVPHEWQTKTNAHECLYLYDKEQNLLKLVDSSDHDNVIDILDPDDVIGVTVEVNVLKASSSPRATTSTETANAPPTDTLTDTNGHAVLTIYAYPRRDPNHPPETGSSILRWCGLGKSHPNPHPNYKRPQGDECQTWGNRYAFHRHLKVVPSEDMAPLNALVQAIRQAAKLKADRGPALVIVNPKSGPKQNAEAVYDNVVNVLLDQAGVEHDLLVTAHPGHAAERAAKGYDGKDISEYSSLISVGGDGIAHECLQGLRKRDDWREILKNITVGFIGAGTSNGMAKSIARASQEQSSVLDAAFLVAKGHTNTHDISEYQTTNESYWSFLTFSWAVISSIDIDSEVLRTLGPLRFDLWGVYCVLTGKSYRAKFTYLPAQPRQQPETEPLPALAEEITSTKWVTEEDDYYVFWASHVTDAAENSYHSPPTTMDDGIFQIMILRYGLK